MEQQENKIGLTSGETVYTNTPCMGRPPKPEAERRSKLFPLRLTPGEIAEFEAASRRLGESVAAILRKGGMLYAARGKDESKQEERKQ